MLAEQLKYKAYHSIKPSDEPLWGAPSIQSNQNQL